MKTSNLSIKTNQYFIPNGFVDVCIRLFYFSDNVHNLHVPSRKLILFLISFLLYVLYFVTLAIYVRLLCDAMLCYIMYSCCLMPCYVILCTAAVWCHVMLSYVQLLFEAMLCYIMYRCCLMPCYVILCTAAVWCHVMFYYDIYWNSSSPNFLT